MTAARQRISVVVPVFNGAATIVECLHALRNQTKMPDEVLIVDNHSTDETANLVARYIDEQRFLEAQVVHETQPGASSARNRGVQAATGDLIFFTDADCEPTPQWVEDLADAFDSDATIGAVAGNVAGKEPCNLLQLFLCMHTLRGGSRGARFDAITPRSGGFPTANFGVRRALFEDVGGFDENLRISGEDYDLCARIYRAGFAIRYTEKALVIHAHRATVTGMVKQSFGFGFAHALGLRRYYEPRIALQIPGRFLEWRWGERAAWIDLVSAEKKLLALLLIAWWQPVFIVLVVAYPLYLERKMRRRMRCMALRGGFNESMRCVGLLFLRSAAMTLGRWYGAWRYRAVCF